MDTEDRRMGRTMRLMALGVGSVSATVQDAGYRHHPTWGRGGPIVIDRCDATDMRGRRWSDAVSLNVTLRSD